MLKKIIIASSIVLLLGSFGYIFFKYQIALSERNFFEDKLLLESFARNYCYDEAKMLEGAKKWNNFNDIKVIVKDEKKYFSATVLDPKGKPVEIKTDLSKYSCLPAI